MLDLGRTVINYKNAFYKIYFLHYLKKLSIIVRVSDGIPVSETV